MLISCSTGLSALYICGLSTHNLSMRTCAVRGEAKVVWGGSRYPATCRKRKFERESLFGNSFVRPSGNCPSLVHQCGKCFYTILYYTILYYTVTTPTTTSTDQVCAIFLGIRPQFSVSGIEANVHRTSFSPRFLWCPWLSSISALC